MPKDLKKIRKILELIKLAKYYKMSTFKEDQYFHKTRAENFEKSSNGTHALFVQCRHIFKAYIAISNYLAV